MECRFKIAISLWERLCPFATHVPMPNHECKINFSDLEKEKTILYVMIPYQACNMEWYISFLTTQSLDILMEQARKHQSGCLKYPVCFTLDNFRNNIYAPQLSEKLRDSSKIGFLFLFCTRSLYLLAMYYSDEWESMLRAADVLVYLGALETDELIPTTEMYLIHCFGAQLAIQTHPLRSICILCKETSEAKRLAAHNRELCSQFADVLRKVLQDAEYCAVCVKGEKPIYDCLYHADDLDRNGYKKRFKYNRIDWAEISKD